MIRSGRRGRISPSEVFPAGHSEYRTTFLELRSGLRIRAVERGNASGPPVVLVPGWGCSVYSFRFTMPALAQAGYRAIAVDLKGHGLSDKPSTPAEYTIDSLVEHLAEILRRARAGSDRTWSDIRWAGRFSTISPPAIPTARAHSGLLSPVGLSGVPPMRIYHALTPPLSRAGSAIFTAPAPGESGACESIWRSWHLHR